MADEKPRGAALVNDELEVGYDSAFERKWRTIELVSHGLMAAIVIAALAGLFGRGPLSHRTHWTPDHRFGVDFEPLARYGTTTQVTLHLSSPDPDVPVDVFVSSALIEPMGLQSIFPRPLDREAIGGGITYRFMIPAGQDSGLARFVLKPATVGPVQIELHQGDASLSFRQWVLP